MLNNVAHDDVASQWSIGTYTSSDRSSDSVTDAGAVHVRDLSYPRGVLTSSRMKFAFQLPYLHAPANVRAEVWDTSMMTSMYADG